MMFSGKLFTIVAAVFAIAVNGSPIAANGSPANGNGSPTNGNVSPVNNGSVNKDGAKDGSQQVRRPSGSLDVDPCVDVDDGEI
jgi:hypothetical protein